MNAPWEFDNRDSNNAEYAHLVVVNSKGHVLFDTSNSDVQTYELERADDDMVSVQGEAREAMQMASAAPDMLTALNRALMKLNAYVGVCNGDKELTGAIIPMVEAAIAKAEGKL